MNIVRISAQSQLLVGSGGVYDTGSNKLMKMGWSDGADDLEGDDGL